MRSVEHTTIVIERRYPASPERTFGAWADPEIKARWLGVSGELELDFRVGGRERHAGPVGDGRDYICEAVYHDIAPPRRIVYSYAMVLDGKRESASLATVEIGRENDRTRLVYTEQGAFFDGLGTPASREHGMGVLLDELLTSLDG